MTLGTQPHSSSPKITDKINSYPLYQNDRGQKYADTTIRVVSADERNPGMHESLKWDQLPIESGLGIQGDDRYFF